MPKSYLKFYQIAGLFFLSFIIFIFVSPIGFFLWILALLSILIIFRKKNISFQETNKNNKDLAISPVSGVINAVLDGVNHPLFGVDLIQVRISCFPPYEFGLYGPSSGEVQVAQKSAKGLNIGMVNLNSKIIGIEIIPVPNFVPPTYWISAGDKVSASARIGHLQWAGKIYLFLPAGSDVFVKKGQKLYGGETAIASL